MDSKYAFEVTGDVIASDNPIEVKIGETVEDSVKKKADAETKKKAEGDQEVTQLENFDGNGVFSPVLTPVNEGY